jgi:hypothetical protein
VRRRAREPREPASEGADERAWNSIAHAVEEGSHALDVNESSDFLHMKGHAVTVSVRNSTSDKSHPWHALRSGG